jgi:hypothetical protein
MMGVRIAPKMPARNNPNQFEKMFRSIDANRSRIAGLRREVRGLLLTIHPTEWHCGR